MYTYLDDDVCEHCTVELTLYSPACAYHRPSRKCIHLAHINKPVCSCQCLCCCLSIVAAAIGYGSHLCLGWGKEALSSCTLVISGGLAGVGRWLASVQTCGGMLQ